MVTIPERLKKGDAVGIICPSSGIHPSTKHRIYNAISCIESLGYKVKLGKTIFSEMPYVSGSIEDRVEDFNQMFLDDEIKMIIPAIGGWLANQILNFIDYNIVKKHPKIFLGYSDITVLHHALYTQGDLATYYGPAAVTQFAEYPKMHDYTLNSLLRAVSLEYKQEGWEQIESSKEWTDEFLPWGEKKDLERARKMVPNKGMWWQRDGRSEGLALPSCVISINHLAGTKYWIDAREKILILDVLLEEGSINYPTLDAGLTDLYNMGVFSEINGLVISRLALLSEDEKRDFYCRLGELTKGSSYPILCDFDIGHTDPINTIRYDAEMLLDSKNNKVCIKN